MKPGMTAIVFDPKLWNYKDVGDNSQFWKKAEVLDVYIKDGDELADAKYIAKCIAFLKKEDLSYENEVVNKSYWRHEHRAPKNFD